MKFIIHPPNRPFLGRFFVIFEIPTKHFWVDFRGGRAWEGSGCEWVRNFSHGHVGLFFGHFSHGRVGLFFGHQSCQLATCGHCATRGQTSNAHNLGLIPSNGWL